MKAQVHYIKAHAKYERCCFNFVYAIAILCGTASKHTLELCRTLIDAGASIEAADARGVTPFLVCCASGRSVIFICLLYFE